MKISITGTIIVFVALFASACGSEPQATDPASVAQDFYDKLNEGDLDGAMTYVPEEATYLTFETLLGKERIRDFFQRQFERNTHWEVSDLEVDGAEVRLTLNITSDVATIEMIHVVDVEDGMMISLLEIQP